MSFYARYWGFQTIQLWLNLAEIYSVLDQVKLDKILFLDIETVPEVKDFDELSATMQEMWTTKAAQRYPNEERSPSDLYRHAAIFAEFGRIICISCGFFNGNSESLSFRIKSFYGHDEKKLLSEFATLLNASFGGQDNRLCAHNGKEFDYPFMARRMLIRGVKLPQILNTPGKKPWEVNHLDTMELWKFGDYKNYTSLKLLTSIFDIPTPKDDIDGSMIRDVYYEEENLKRIVTYCQKDVLAVARLFQKFRGEEIVKDDQLIFSDHE